MDTPAAISGQDQLFPAAEMEWGGAGGSALMDFAVNDEDPLFLPWAREEIPPPALIPPPPPPPPAPLCAPPTPPPSATSGGVWNPDTKPFFSNFWDGRVTCSCSRADAATTSMKVEKAAPAAAGAPLAAGGGRKAKKVRRAAGIAGKCQVPGCGTDIKELKGYHRRHRVCLRCANAPFVVLEGERKRYCQQCGKFHILPDFDNGKRSCRRKLERHNKRRRRRHNNENDIMEEYQGAFMADTTSFDAYKEEMLEEFEDEIDDTILNNKLTERQKVESVCDYDSPCGLLSDFTSIHKDNILSFAACNNSKREEKVDNARSSISSEFCNKNTYSSVCPTERISFKLYDWNPAEFPRQLRHEIFKWLSSMPVELEGYIRPGCTLLTLFIAMPQSMWDKLSHDVSSYVKNLLLAPDSLFVGRGNMHISISNTIVHVSKDGMTSTDVSLDVQVPRIHYIFPTVFEAGQSMELIACGSNLNRPKFRFLVSFSGKYLELDSCLAISQDINSTHGNHHEMFKINICHTDPKIYGPGFIEVENEAGVSNFIPILFGDKRICSELERMYCDVFENRCLDSIISLNLDVKASSGFCEALVSKQRKMSALLLDMAWFLARPGLEKNGLLNVNNIQRLTNLMKSLIQNESLILLEELLINLQVIDLESINDTVDSYADLNVLWSYVKRAKELLSQRTRHILKFNPQVPFSPNESHDTSNTSLRKIQDGEGKKTDSSGSMIVDPQNQEDEAAPLICGDTRARIPALNRCSGSTYDTWGASRSIISGINNIASMRLILVLAVCGILCFLACSTFLHPHDAGEAVISLRHLFHH